MKNTIGTTQVPIFSSNNQVLSNDDLFNTFQTSAAFHIETNLLICKANQMTGFYMECNTGLK